MRQNDKQALVIDSYQDSRLLRALASEVRVRILELLQNREHNVTEVAKELGIPQSTTTTSILQLEEGGLVESHTANGVKGG
ncbi:MAG: helix-turn-helix domain-containing protein, partial [Treponema sp.]|nr:helix-turn-helix domain-containing protein [Treponema sp.]